MICSDGEYASKDLKALLLKAGFMKLHWLSLMISLICLQKWFLKLKCSIQTVKNLVNFSLPNRIGLYLNFTSSIWRPNESSIKSVIKMESNFNNWGSNYEHHFNACGPKSRQPSKCWCSKVIQIKQQRVQ